MGKILMYAKLAISNIKKNTRIYIPYIISAMCVIMMFYNLMTLRFAINAEKTLGGGTVAFCLLLGSVVTVIFSVLFLFYTNSFIIKRRKRELGLYNILGMEKKHISIVVLFETIIIAILSIAGGLLFGLAFSKLMFLILERLLASGETITFLISYQSMGFAAIFFSAIFLLTLLYNLIQIVKSKPIELLHGSNVGEKEPKANWLIALIGIGCIGIGYYMSAFMEKSAAEAFLLFFVAVILVIIGTYALFSAAITAILKMLKKNKRFYYKAKNFISTSSLIYRMKQNAAGLATICILSTFVLVMISTTFSLYASVENQIKLRYPHDFSIYIYDNENRDDTTNNKAFEEISNNIDNKVEEMGITPDNIKKYGYLDYVANLDDKELLPSDSYLSNSNTAEIQIITLEDYNKTVNEPETLNDNEILAISKLENELAGRTVNLGGKEYSVRAKDEGFINGSAYSFIYNGYLLVVKDVSTVNQIRDYIISKDLSVLTEYYYGFDIGDKEIGNAFVESMYAEASNLWEKHNVNAFIESSYTQEDEYRSLFGGLFFVGLFLGVLFTIALVLIIYYKQVSEGYDDKNRFEIMQKVGMSHSEVKRSIRSQVLMMFFIPLVVSLLHLFFAMPFLMDMMGILGFNNKMLMWSFTGLVVAVFALIYVFVYSLTARTYYKILKA